jgi:DMSO/TMAO reductase YedYZ molybdopterin-dependent catalytic subunit
MEPEMRGHDGTDRRPDGGISRRRFLLGAATAGASSLLAACGWRGGPFADELSDFSGFNDRVSAGLFSGARLVREYPRARRTPEPHFPAYFVSRGMPTLQDPASWRLEVGGLVRRPAVLTLEQLQALPRLTYTVKHHCVEGWTAIASWSGARFAALAERVEPLPQARYVMFRSFDSGYSNGWDMASALHPQTILAYAYNDRQLMPGHGAPLRLYSPTKLGYKLTKYLVSVEFTADRPGGYWEDRGYPWFGGV